VEKSRNSLESIKSILLFHNLSNYLCPHLHFLEGQALSALFATPYPTPKYSFSISFPQVLKKLWKSRKHCVKTSNEGYPNPCCESF